MASHSIGIGECSAQHASSTARSTASHRAGFTLIEVMVALTILAVALAAGYRALGQSSNNADLLKRRALAQWVAQNQVAAMQLRQAPGATGAGQSSMGGVDFVWRSTMTQTPNPTFRRIEIVVADRTDPDYQLARLAAYLSVSE